MRILNHWQRSLHKRVLATKLKQLPLLPRLIPDKAKKIAIIFDATPLDNRKKIEVFAQKLKNAGKQVTLFAYLNDKTKQGLPFRFFNKKDLTWQGIPKGFEVERFLAESFDLLYAFYIGENLPLEYIGALTKAHFKIGAYNGQDILYDISIDTQDIDLQYLISQTDYFLTRITKSQDELSAV
jgi:hypothetical protein